MSNAIDAEFAVGATDPLTLPDFGLPEVALLGRSNVGKSTLINKLTHQKNLARVSSTPGRTTQINLFKISQNKEPRLILADLPGYGYAKMSKGEHKKLGVMIRSYLEERTNLSLICLLNDVRREPEEEEIVIRDSAFESGIPLIVVLTKADKLSNNQLAKAKQKLAKFYRLDVPDFVTSGANASIQPLWNRIFGLLGAES